MNFFKKSLFLAATLPFFVGLSARALDSSSDTTKASATLVETEKTSDPATPTTVGPKVSNDPVDEASGGIAKMLSDRGSGDDNDGDLVAISVPIASFIFVLLLVLGSKYIREQGHRRRLEILKMMLEKGQSIPPDLLKEMASNGGERNLDPLTARMKQLRNGFALTGVGIALCAYRVLDTSSGHEKALVFGLVAMGLGIGLLLSYKFSKPQ